MDMNKTGMGQNGGNMMKPDFQAMPNNQGIENNLDGQMPVPNGEMNGNMPAMPDMSNMPNFENMPNMEDMPNVEGRFNWQIPNGNIPEGLPEDFMNKGNGKMPNMMGGNIGGADLKYIDDNIESYSTITESAEFKTTTEADFQKIVDMIKNLNNGENLEKYLNVEEILKYFAVNSMINEYVKNDATAFYTYDEYEKSLPELKKFIENRGKSIIAQLNGEQPSTEYGNIEATFTLSALGGHSGNGKGGPNKNMDKFNGGAGMPQAPGINMPQLPAGIENSMQQITNGQN